MMWWRGLVLGFIIAGLVIGATVAYTCGSLERPTTNEHCAVTGLVDLEIMEDLSVVGRIAMWMA